jgi:hypothetical protein
MEQQSETKLVELHETSSLQIASGMPRTFCDWEAAEVRPLQILRARAELQSEGNYVVEPELFLLKRFSVAIASALYETYSNFSGATKRVCRKR